MSRIHIKNPREMCFIQICRSTELNMQLDFTGPLRENNGNQKHIFADSTSPH